MTQNQIAWYDAQTRRMAHEHTRQIDTATLSETNRANVAKERETNRTNVAQELERHRTNVANEAINWQKNMISQQDANTRSAAQTLSEAQSPSVIERNIQAASRDYYSAETARHNLNEWLHPLNIANRYAQNTAKTVQSGADIANTLTTALHNASSALNKGVATARSMVNMTTDLLGDVGATVLKALV